MRQFTWDSLNSGSAGDYEILVSQKDYPGNSLPAPFPVSFTGLGGESQGWFCKAFRFSENPAPSASLPAIPR
jgi:hypothetical protein